VTENRAIAQCE